MRIKSILIALYKDFQENKLTAKQVAEDYWITEAEANVLITAGKNLTEIETRKDEKNEESFELNGSLRLKYIVTPSICFPNPPFRNSFKIRMYSPPSNISIALQ